jgi:hypothetical protein
MHLARRFIAVARGVTSLNERTTGFLEETSLVGSGGNMAFILTPTTIGHAEQRSNSSRWPASGYMAAW